VYDRRHRLRLAIGLGERRTQFTGIGSLTTPRTLTAPRADDGSWRFAIFAKEMRNR
jgi:hypothetical protein